MTNQPQTDHLQTIQTAIAAGHKLHLHYTATPGNPTTRTIWPITLTQTHHHPLAVPLLAAWCELRTALRTFRTDRIDALTPTNTPHHHPITELRAHYIATKTTTRPTRTTTYRPPQSPPPTWTTLAQRLSRVAEHLAAGRRETPQRFIPIATHATRHQRARPLLSFLLNDAATHAQTDPACTPPTRTLLTQAALRIATDGPNWHSDFTHALGPAIQAAAPQTHRRRHIHCHGWTTPDRRLLLLRTVLNHGANPDRYDLTIATAYAMSNYDYDHFEMTGPAVATRIHRLAAWVRQQ